MLRKLTGAALATVVAGGVYFAAMPADASNMGFKLERSFKLEREDATNRAFLNIYFVSFPLFNGLDPNLANSYPTAAECNNSPTCPNKCVNDTTGPNGPTVGDDFLNADDALCDLWTSRDGFMTINHFNSGTCVTEIRTAEKSGFGVVFRGTWDSYIDTNADGIKDTPDPNQALDTDRATNPSALDDYRGIGYQINVGHATAGTPTHENRSVIVGSHDPNASDIEIRYTCAPALVFLNVPYHTMYRNADNILCGLEIARDPVNGWEDLRNNANGQLIGDPDGDTVPNGDGEPDTCTNGIFDEGAANGYVIQVATFDNVDDGTGPRPDGSDTDNGTVLRIATKNAFGFLRFQQDNFLLTPGDSYQVTLTNRHISSFWRSPHF